MVEKEGVERYILPQSLLGATLMSQSCLCFNPWVTLCTGRVIIVQGIYIFGAVCNSRHTEVLEKEERIGIAT